MIVSDTGPRVLPSWRSGGFCEQLPVGSEEVSAALMDALLGVGFGCEACGAISSHSLKATWLTIAGKFGLPVGQRQLLGYHVVRVRSRH